MFCKYKDIFGEPNKGVHSYRVGGLVINGGLAVVDVIGMLLLNWAIVRAYDLDFFTTLIWMILATILIHYLFCVPTALNKALNIA